MALTLSPFNRTVIPGLVQPGIPGAGNLLYDALDNKVFGTPGANGATPVFNGSTGDPVSTFDLPVSSPTMALDPALDEVFAAGAPWTVVAFKGSNESIVYRNITVGHGPDSIVYDATDDRLFVACQYDSDIWIVDPQNGTAVGQPIPVYSAPLSLLYEPNGDQVLVSVTAKRVLALNASSDVWDPAVNWSVSGGPYTMALDPKPNLVYIGNEGTGNVTVMNASSNSHVGSGISVGSALQGILYYPLLGAIIVATGGSVAEINVTSNAVIRSSPAAPGAFGLVYDSATGMVFCSAGDALGAWPSDYLIEFDPRSNLTGRELQLQYTFTASLYDATNGEMYLINPTGPNGTGAPTGVNWTVFGQSSILEVDSTSHWIANRALPAGNDAVALTLADSNQKLFAADQTLSTVSIDTLSNGSQTLVSLASGFEPDALALDPASDHVFVGGDGGSTLAVLNGSTGSVVSSSVPAGNGTSAMLYDPALKELFVANCRSNNVTVIDPLTLLPRGAGIPVGACPTALALDPLSGLMFVANGNSGNLTVVNTSSGTGVASIAVGLIPNSVVYDPANGLIYVANLGSDTISVINPQTLTNASPPINVLPPGAPSNVGPTGLSFDAKTSEIYVPTLFDNAVFVLADDPGPVSLTLNTPTPEVGLPLEFTTNASGGHPPYAYRYAGLPRGCASQDTPVELCNPLAGGQFRVVVAVSDSENHSGYAATTATVIPALEAGTLSISPSPDDAGVPVSIVLNPAGGTLPLSISYSGLPSGCTSANSSLLSCDPNAPGTYLIKATLTDMAGAIDFSEAILEVEAEPAISYFLALPAEPVAGSTVTLDLGLTGGVGPFSYSYGGLPTGCGTSNVSVLVCKPSASGHFVVTALLTDSLRMSARSSVDINVSPIAESAPPLITAFFAFPSNLTLGSSTIFVVEMANPSSSPITYSFVGLPPGCSSADLRILTCTPTATGTYRLTVDASGPSGNTSSSTQVVVVQTTPPPAGPPGPPGRTLTWDILLPVALAAGFTGGTLTGLIWRRYFTRRRDGSGRAEPPVT